MTNVIARFRWADHKLNALKTVDSFFDLDFALDRPPEQMNLAFDDISGSKPSQDSRALCTKSTCVLCYNG